MQKKIESFALSEAFKYKKNAYFICFSCSTLAGALQETNETSILLRPKFYQKLKR